MTIKKNLIPLMLLFPASLMAQNVNYTLKGKIGTINAPAKVYLGYKNAVASFIDSTTINNGVFEFKGTVAYPVEATLVLSYTVAGPRNGPAETMGVYLEGGDIQISSADSLGHATIAGGKTNSDYKRLREALNASDEKMYEVTSGLRNLPADKKKDKTFMTAYMADYIKRQKAIIAEQNEIRAAFIRKNPASMASLDALKTIDKFVSEYTVTAPLFNLLAENVKNTGDGREFSRKLDKMKVMEVGSMALPFTQTNAEGELVKLSDFQGKYVLVDFWASWCYACRLENPNVVKAYQKYHDKGLEILAVSLDKAKEPWIKAIEKDGLPWVHVSDLKGWKNEVAVLYGVKAIPQNLLLDKTGRIIGKNLKGAALEAKLAGLLK